jgi:FKBP-type peptidyl-prolyl cis-trans isomerase
MQLNQIRQEAATNPNAQQFLDQLETNAARADSFLTANAQQEGIQTTASGLQYRVLTPGAGETPQRGESVLMSYTLSLPDGTELQQSEEPIVFELDEEGLISGMLETLTAMRPGERRQVYIPPALGYGTLGEPRAGIGPNTVLVFDVTLEEIMDPVADPGAGTAAPGTPPVPTPAQ